MWIQVRSADNLKAERVDGLSKMTKIKTLKKMLVALFDAPVQRQRLFFQGKQLEDDHSLFDYNVGLNNVVQILVKAEVTEESQVENDKENLNTNIDSNGSEDANVASSPGKLNKNRDSHCLNGSEGVNVAFSPAKKASKSEYFKIGETINARDPNNGAWFEGKIIDIQERDGKNAVQDEKFQSSLIYVIEYANYDNDVEQLPLEKIRPIFKKLTFDDVKIGDTVLANYNIDEPDNIGYWYKCEIMDKRTTRRQKELIGTIIMGSEDIAVHNCKVFFPNEIYSMTDNAPLTEREVHEVADSLRPIQVNCSHCKDDPDKKCIHCSCHECGGKDDPGKQLMCDECDCAYHIGCLDPPLEDIPEDDEWYCPLCKNDESEIVKAGEKLKSSKKKAKMASAKSKTKRDWGRGMATVGRTKICTIVPQNHFGPVPGVEVGMSWRYRLQASECGVHRPHVAGIHGRDQEGAFSIVLAGGYEDDLDNGYEFYYTGSGGRDLSGNKRTAVQSCDQTLTLMNKALASNCAAPLNQNGAEAKNWKEGKPVRVLRSAKGQKHSKYCPKVGVRYDGVYKVVKYWKEAGKSGFYVWRYLLRRDDPTPAPYTKEGKMRMKDLGFVVQYPEGYAGPMEEEEEEAVDDENKQTKKGKRSNENGKRSRKDSSAKSGSPTKKRKKSVYTIPKDIEEIIARDEQNVKVWEQCKSHASDGISEFLKEVEVQFGCICCQDMLVDPVTTECSHNICKNCLARSFKADVYSCPMCRQSLDPKTELNVNNHLKKILLKLFPGYSKGR